MSEDNVAIPATNMEPRPIDAPLGAQKIKRLDSQCRIHIHSVRKKLTDADGICAKYAIDGLIHAGILPDDSPKWVQAVSYSQEKGKEEKTIIEIKVITE